MSMTRKDYELIALALSKVTATTDAEKRVKQECVTYIAAVLQGANPLFQPARFVVASGLPQ